MANSYITLYKSQVKELWALNQVAKKWGGREVVAGDWPEKRSRESLDPAWEWHRWLTREAGDWGGWERQRETEGQLWQWDKPVQLPLDPDPAGAGSGCSLLCQIPAEGEGYGSGHPVAAPLGGIQGATGSHWQGALLQGEGREELMAHWRWQDAFGEDQQDGVVKPLGVQWPWDQYQEGQPRELLAVRSR